MTKRLYYDNQRLCDFEAKIISDTQTELGPAICLDQTAFYPTSGGQPHDTGTINGIPIISVWEDGEHIWHNLERLPERKEVTGIVDWSRRFDHMQQHTGQHILSAALVDHMDANTIGFHLGEGSSTIDLDIIELPSNSVKLVEDIANQMVWENRLVTIHTITDDEINSIPFRKPPQVKGKIRIIWVEGFDASACGGTHVSRTGEIGLIKITRNERYKGGIRVTFLCGNRALRYYQRILTNIQQVSMALSIHQNELPKAIARLQKEVTTIRRCYIKTRRELLGYEAESLWKDNIAIEGKKRIYAHLENRTMEDLQTIANKLREYPKTIVLLAATEGENIRLLCTRSSELHEPNADQILKEAAFLLGGRGGGSPVMAHGGAPISSHQTVIEVLQKAILLY
jgi:alanyl-tRNA synthetase